MATDEPPIRRAAPGDAAVVARLLHDFNDEFEDFTPPVDVLTPRVAELIEAGEITVLLGGEPPCSLSLLRLKPSLWTGLPDAYLEELYVVPERRGEGIGRALLEATIEEARRAGADHIDLTTGEDDTAARGLYDSLGFTNREGRPDGPAMLYYEREI
jgi:ribosomal protein S18 acetylase RimI-like enzyme